MLHMEMPGQSITVPEHPTSPTKKPINTSPRRTPLTYRHTLEIYLKDSNAYANTYFSRYFEWQGICRERWFHDCITEDMLQPHGVLITKRAEQEYLRETFPFQKVECRLNSYNIRKCSFHLIFRFAVGGEPVAVGRQQIVFANHDKEIRPFPPQILEKVKRYALRAPG